MFAPAGATMAGSQVPTAPMAMAKRPPMTKARALLAQGKRGAAVKAPGKGRKVL